MSTGVGVARTAFTNAVSERIWDQRYRYRAGGKVLDADPEASWWRVARALAGAEPTAQASWAERFHALLADFVFLPGGRILAGAGTRHRVTLFNCFVMGVVPDSLAGILALLRESALTLQQGGGIGCDFSALRPAGLPAPSSGNVATGPVSFLHLWDDVAKNIQSLGERRSAMMATLRCDHPDILEFIDAKRGGGLGNFNLSVQITAEFMQALEQNSEWALVFPASAWSGGTSPETVMRRWPGQAQPVACRVVRRLPAHSLWQALAAAAGSGDPGVLFVDRINAENNLWYDEYLSATNPCGEVPLPAYGACNLGSFNLTAFVRAPFTQQAAFDFERLRSLVPLAVRFLDDAIEISRFPVALQAQTVRRSRRLGLGITGFADTLIMLGLHYASEAARTFASRLMQLLRDEAYVASISLAGERGAFPSFDRERYLRSGFTRRLPESIRQGIAAHGMRNSHLLAIAPTGTISLLANNISSGIEPVFDYHVRRRIHMGGGAIEDYPLTDYAWRLWQAHAGDAQPGAAFVTASQLPAASQLAMLAALQPFVDNAISKTINLSHAQASGFEGLFLEAYRLGLKGCTVYKTESRRDVIKAVDPGLAGMR
ncbi:MAG: adenosylcobalamin-dependent ribonucleoside-diphosphate reductase [Gammaproteobacteria bacterium]|nr:adenosylcobalamin-dependent ribonucleoside-diphosphate reductase [Gammaproteobacteria bacterium]